MSSPDGNQSPLHSKRKRSEDGSNQQISEAQTNISINKFLDSTDFDTPCSSPPNITPGSDDKPHDVPLHPNESLGRSPSVVWQHFKKVKVDGKDKVECNYCSRKLVGGAKNGTKHLHDHYRICPRRKSQDVGQMLLAGSKKYEDKKMTLTTYHFDQEKGRKDLATMIILHEYPLSMVDHYGFRRFCNSIQPLFKVVSRNTIKKDILNIYDIEKEKTMKLLNKNQGRVAITCDMWTANNQNKGYMTITTHFIDNSWVLQSRIIRFVYVPCPHTKEILSAVLVDSFYKWNIDRKLSTLTVDNCTTNDALIDDLLIKLPRNRLMLDGTLFHMRCCAHILNLIVQDGLSVIREAIEKIRESVGYWSASPKRVQRFEEASRQLCIPSSKKLALDCKTRWNSTYLMLETALIYREVFYRLKHREAQYKCLPSEDEWEMAQEICEKLQFFYISTLSFSGTQYPTANIYFPIICKLKIELSKWVICGKDVIEKMAKKMRDKFDKYWSVIHGIMGVAIVLDPRYKMGLLNFFFPKIYGDASKDEIGRIQKFCYDMLWEYQSKEGHYQAYGSSSSQRNVHNPSDYLEEYDIFMEQEVNNNEGKSELDHYLEEKVLPRTPDFDVLAWWKSNGPKYPTLQMIAKDILAIPVSTVASESAFSTGGRVVSPHRNSLHPETLEALMCSQNWLSTEIQGQGSCSANDQQYCTIFEDNDVDDEVSGDCEPSYHLRGNSIAGCKLVQALMGVKESLEDPHNILENWDRDSVDPCSWTMVTCSAENLVIGLLLQNNKSGPIPQEIGKLSRLHTLDLSNNFFTGKIPSSLSHLKSLEYL
ncbi:zinc finger BED domain-containing protein RICESLEEPER 1-like [Tasmannia lanceolata]|uniref:zinc finger BED domain-containing protein RICESLEEPER 1-like n=1 Tax=Tasmannia lanceolata TaxID=3420 RepID=UPI004063070E